MTDGNAPGYPTQGELIRFLFNIAGVLPAKRDSTTEFDDQERRRVQKALERLAGEEGELEENFGEMIQQLAYLVAGHVTFPPVNLALGEVVHDLLDVYRQVFREEGTYLNKRDTLKWVIEARWASAAAVSVARQITRVGIRPLVGYFPPMSKWYLPDVQEGKVVTALSKVMRWVYTAAGASQTQFHYPQRGADESDPVRQRDLENAQNWIAGRSLPCAATLRWTFDRAFAAQRSSQTDESGESGPRTLLRAEGARISLFIARCSAYVSLEIEKHFGLDFLTRVCDVFYRTLALALEDTTSVEHAVVRIAREQGVSPLDPELRGLVVDRWDQELKLRLQCAGSELAAAQRAEELTPRRVRDLAQKYGRLPVEPAADWLQAPAPHEPPPGFMPALLDGLSLARDRDLTRERVDSYEAPLRSSGMERSLPWMVPWLRFLVCYRQEEDEQAWIWISQAYEEARYRAGAGQYEIVNHYIEMAAKMGKRRLFERGVRWARYIGMEVRWLREKEPTQENLGFVMEVMKRGRYGI